MAYDPKKHHRRSVRLKGYDYATAGAYFLTVCTQGRACLFGSMVKGEMRLNAAGCMVQDIWNEIAPRYAGVDTDGFQIMPNHIHGIIVITPRRVGANPRVCPTDSACPGDSVSHDDRAGTGARPYTGAGPNMGVRPYGLGDVLRRFKSLTTKRYMDGVQYQGWPPFSGPLWQRNYYEHVIRDGRSLNRIREYIAANPLQWEYDRENPVGAGSRAWSREDGPWRI
jgi:REP element-mobilizing transposase RayT